MDVADAFVGRVVLHANASLHLVGIDQGIQTSLVVHQTGDHTRVREVYMLVVFTVPLPHTDHTTNRQARITVLNVYKLVFFFIFS